jgi:hypothetical protein
MRTDPQQVAPVNLLRARWATLLGAVSLAWFGSMPASIGEAIEPIMLTGGAMEGSGAEYRISGAVEPMRQEDSVGPGTDVPSVIIGFWSMQEAVKASPPILQVMQEGARLILFWPASAEGYVLQRAFRLGPEAQWTEIPEPYETDGTHVHATLGMEASPQFFRLHRMQ